MKIIVPEIESRSEKMFLPNGKEIEFKTKPIASITLKYTSKLENISHSIQKILRSIQENKLPERPVLYKVKTNKNNDIIITLRKRDPINFVKSIFRKNKMIIMKDEVQNRGFGRIDALIKAFSINLPELYKDSILD